MAASPIDQFKVNTIGNDIIIGGINISFNNSALFMVISVILIFIGFYVSLKQRNIIPNKLQMVSEMSYDFVHNIVQDNIKGKKANKFFPLIYTIFCFFLFGNLIGLIPYSFTFTSQIIVTLTVSSFIMLLSIIYGIYLHKLKIIKIFLPSGIPIALAPVMFVLEFISFFAKGISMGVRLFANMMAGHIILEVIGGFIVVLGIFGIIPLSLSVLVYGFELGIGFIQAYIFTILSCIFLDQVINLH